MRRVDWREGCTNSLWFPCYRTHRPQRFSKRHVRGQQDNTEYVHGQSEDKRTKSSSDKRMRARNLNPHNMLYHTCIRIWSSRAVRQGTSARTSTPQAEVAVSHPIRGNHNTFGFGICTIVGQRHAEQRKWNAKTSRYCRRLYT